ncbi:hypothetical protein N7460_000625 [Penicillium canescens]|uniref:Uncharacterized protein n=1 Tax=Penicillium canescens TaxID=5083 RepID=A0AAD6INJ4_PENCN|nr:hypothetical protein N7460_000625 [Penicillium canescens]
MKFTTVFGVAALFMAPSAMAWKLPHVDQADSGSRTEQPAPSGAIPSGTAPSGTIPSGTAPSSFPSGGFGGFGGFGGQGGFPLWLPL